MNIAKISAQNPIFGLQIGPKLQKSFDDTTKQISDDIDRRTYSRYTRFMPAAFLAASGQHALNIIYIKDICPKKTIDIISHNKNSNTVEYEIFDNNKKGSGVKFEIEDDLHYNGLVKKLKQLQEQNII